MILLCGVPSESPLAMIREQLHECNVTAVMFNQRQVASTEMSFDIARGRITGLLKTAGRRYRLEDVEGVYIRLMDDRFLPELEGLPEDAPAREYSRSLHDTLVRWAELAPIRVVNRMEPMGSNFSKPYQAQLLLEQGFKVPETLITNDPELVHEFYDRHRRVIYKSISGVRSIVHLLKEEDLKRLHHIRWCPTQFQEFIDGTNVRVHTVHTSVFATAIRSEATDYRYANQQSGHQAILEAMELPDTLAEKCVRLSAALGLTFAGIDLKITPDQQVYCFEVNPSPAFSYYEAHTGQPISRAVARFLAAGY